jgi:hypothetical protein
MALALVLVVTCGCNATNGPGGRTGTSGPPNASDRCGSNDDCPRATPYCCDVAGDDIGRDCFQHDFTYGGQQFCGDDECATDGDCPVRKPHCCAIGETSNGPVLACYAAETTSGACY